MRATGVKVVNGAALPVHKGSCKGTVGVRIPRTRRWYTHWQTGRRAIHPRPASPVLSCRSLAIEGRLVLTCYVAGAYVDCCASAGILRQPILGWPPCSACIFYAPQTNFFEGRKPGVVPPEGGKPAAGAAGGPARRRRSPARSLFTGPCGGT